MKPVKDKSQTFTSVVEYFKSAHDVKQSGASNIKLGARTFTPIQFFKKFTTDLGAIQEFCGEVSFVTTLTELRSDRNFSREQALEYMSDQVFGKLRYDVEKESKQKLVRSGNDLDKSKYDYTMHVPIVDIATNQRVLFDSATQQIDENASFEAWSTWVKSRPAKDRPIIEETLTPAKVMFDPYEEKLLYFKDIGRQKGIMHINSHVMPTWRTEKERPSTLPTHPPKIFLELMHHLFPHEACRDYVYQWMRYAMTDTNECYLFLYGAKGVGKTTLAYLCRELVGPLNYETLDESFWESKFSGELKGKRLAYIDECAVTPKNISKVRAMTNTYISIEEKGLNAITLENKCSYIWASNDDKKHTAIDDEARRFSVPVMGTTSILDQEGMGQEWLDNFHEIIGNRKTNVEFFKQLGYWILDVYKPIKEHSSKHPYKSNNFYVMLNDSLSDWKRDIIDIIRSKANDKYYLDDEDVKRALNGTGRGKLTLFLKTLKDEDGNLYARCLQDTRPNGTIVRYIEVAEKYYPEDIKENLESDTSASDEFNSMEF